MLASPNQILLMRGPGACVACGVCCAAPPMYQDPACVGDPTLGKVPCAPRADALPAWQDYATLLASRWQGGKAGSIRHFIVWNGGALPCPES